MGGSSGGGSSTTTTEPWSEQKPYLEQGFSEAASIYDKGPDEYYTGNTYVPFSDATTTALEGAEQRALDGSAITQNASSYAENVLSGNSGNPYADILSSGVDGLQATAAGENLQGNPYLDSAYDQAANKVTQNFENTVIPGISSQFGLSGGAGGSMHQLMLGEASGELTDSLGSLASDIYGGNYQQERDRQVNAQQNLTSTGQGLYDTGVNQEMNTLNLSPTLATQEYADFDKLKEIGGEYESFAERVLEDDINRFNYEQNKDTATLEEYLRLIQGNFGGTSVTSQQNSSSPLSTGLGAVSLLGSLI